MTKEIKTVKTAAHKLLELFGPKGEHWIQGTKFDGEHRYCLIGAMEKVGVANKVQDQIGLAASEIVNGKGNGEADAYEVIGLNDAENTDWPTIKRFLCKLAHPEREKGGATNKAA